MSIASPMLSKDVIPAFGPAHFSRHTDTFVSQMFAPHLNETIMIMMAVMMTLTLTVTMTMTLTLAMTMTLTVTMLRMELTVHL